MDIFITDVISNATVNRVLQEIIQKKETKDTKEDKKKIVVYINSQGGDVESGYALYEIFKLSGLKIITYAINEVFSSAITVYLAGDERYATNYSNFMVHEPYHEYDEDSNTTMTTKSYKKYLKELQGATNEYFKLICKHTVLTPQRLKRYIARAESGDWYFRAALAKKLGFVTKIGAPLF